MDRHATTRSWRAPSAGDLRFVVTDAAARDRVAPSHSGVGIDASMHANHGAPFPDERRRQQCAVLLALLRPELLDPADSDSDPGAVARCVTALFQLDS